MKGLPQLSVQPMHFANCCASISLGLVQYVAALMPHQPALALSIGSGTGLFEALILSQDSQINLRGVEISACINQYLPDELVDIVLGTWGTSTRASDATVWMFVYPRNPALINDYVRKYGNESVQLIIWLGPKNDLVEHSAALEGLGTAWTNEIVEVREISSYETLATWRRQIFGIRAE